MNADIHEKQLIGGYVLDALTPEEKREMDEHLAGCASCQTELAEFEEVKAMLGEIPPEAVLHGPPNADLVLQRTLRQIRLETSTVVNRRRSFAVAAAVVALAGAIGVGVVLGRGNPTSGPSPVANPSRTTQSAAPQPTGIRSGTVVDSNTNTRLTAQVVPAAGWVRVNASVNGIPANENCRLYVIGKNGSREVAAGWIVSTRGEAEGTNLDGSVAMDPADVVALEVRNTSGVIYATLNL